MPNSDYGYGSGPGLVVGAHSLCARNGCQYAGAIDTLHQAQKLLDRAREARQVMASEWCDSTKEGPDGHAFNGKRGKVIISRKVIEGDGSVSSSDDLVMCKPHASEAGLMPEKDEVIRGELTNGG